MKCLPSYEKRTSIIWQAKRNEEGCRGVGDYTGLRCKIQLKPRFISVIRKVVEAENWENTGYEVLDEFAKMGRSTCIPWGHLNSCMPSAWLEAPEAVALGGFGGYTGDISDGGQWVFQCVLKNYDGEINYFVDGIIPLISSYAHYETYYEYDTESEVRTYRDNLVEIHDGIEYV